MMAFANFDLVAICENDLKPKNFLPMDMALYTIYKGHPGTAAGGLISTETKFSKYKNLFG